MDFFVEYGRLLAVAIVFLGPGLIWLVRAARREDVRVYRSAIDACERERDERVRSID